MNVGTYPNIKPLRTFSDGSKRHTTITKFNDVLEEEENTINESKNDEKSDNKVNNTSNEDKDIIYTNPKTGDVYKYVDVADEKTPKVKKTSPSVSTTSASSMKKTKYDAYFKAAAKKYNVPESLLKAIAKAESNFNPNDVSSAGAIGIMQLMPSTAAGLGVKNPYDPEQNIMGGAKCISLKLKEFNGDVRLALAAYNAGSGAIRRNGGVPSYCKSYINKVLSYKKAYETAKAV